MMMMMMIIIIIIIIIIINKFLHGHAVKLYRWRRRVIDSQAPAVVRPENIAQVPLE